jgi:hypothetical protein
MPASADPNVTAGKFTEVDFINQVPNKGRKNITKEGLNNSPV